MLDLVSWNMFFKFLLLLNFLSRVPEVSPNKSSACGCQYFRRKPVDLPPGSF